MVIQWIKRKMCEWSNCIGPDDLPFRVTNEDEDGQCIEWECPRCGETVRALRISKTFMRKASTRIKEIRAEQDGESVDGGFNEVHPHRIR